MGDSLAVTLRPFFWETRWFLALCGLAAAVAGLLGATDCA